MNVGSELPLDIEKARDARHRAEVEFVEAELATRQRENDAVLGYPFALLGARAPPSGRFSVWRALEKR